ncbi:copper chaperone PCu(A)C [Acuticoccus sp. 2012]|uniref:Copper chaperone PCu(A)C n=2 Tax=Acuticoccus mangrovi TaxID=2796142 RepID=A0A934IT91_9HYPH|nr:copper chaperone PCu(A)C [Acuticoccus mangrovi]
MRQPPPGAEVAGGYATITNPTDAADRLIGASAPFAKSTEIHEMSMVDGMMRMQPVAGGLEIPAGGTVELAPGGYHVMFLELLDQPQAGDTVDVTLEFEHSGSITVPMSVAPIGAQKPAMDMGSGHHMGHGQ